MKLRQNIRHDFFLLAAIATTILLNSGCSHLATSRSSVSNHQNVSGGKQRRTLRPAKGADKPTEGIPARANLSDQDTDATPAEADVDRSDKKIQELENRRTTVQLQAVQTRLASGDTRGAELLLRRILKRKSSRPEVRRLLAQVLVAQERFQEAEQVLRAQLERFPADAVSHHELGLVLETTERGDEAARHFDRALQINPSNPLYQLSAGMPPSPRPQNPAVRRVHD